MDNFKIPAKGSSCYISNAMEPLKLCLCKHLLPFYSMSMHTYVLKFAIFSAFDFDWKVQFWFHA